MFQLQVLTLLLIISGASAFRVSSMRHITSAPSSTLSMRYTIDNVASMPLAELYASPTARYNGELIDKKIKVQSVDYTKPDNYKYGDVSSNATPALFIGALASIILAAAVPRFLAIGDTAKRQQEEYEQQSTFKPRFGKKPIAGTKVGEKKKAGIIKNEASKMKAKVGGEKKKAGATKKEAPIKNGLFGRK